LPFAVKTRGPKLTAKWICPTMIVLRWASGFVQSEDRTLKLLGISDHAVADAALIICDF
jgi:hypothetical protein